jgi:hypothetical protein
MQSAKKAVQAGAPQGEMPSEAGRKTLRLKSFGNRETAGMKGREGMEKGEMTFS